MTRGFEYRHIVTFEETNVVGNVYFTNYFLWQGRCRELFLRDLCPEVLHAIKTGELGMATIDAACSYRSELFADDEVVLSMWLERATHTRMWLHFEYHKVPGATLVATGRQVIGCLRRDPVRKQMVPVEIPESMRAAMERFPKPRAEGPE